MKWNSLAQVLIRERSYIYCFNIIPKWYEILGGKNIDIECFFIPSWCILHVTARLNFIWQIILRCNARNHIPQYKGKYYFYRHNIFYYKQKTFSTIDRRITFLYKLKTMFSTWSRMGVLTVFNSAICLYTWVSLSLSSKYFVETFLLMICVLT